MRAQVGLAGSSLTYSQTSFLTMVLGTTNLGQPIIVGNEFLELEHKSLNVSIFIIHIINITKFYLQNRIYL